MPLPDVQLFPFEGHSVAYRKVGHGPATLLAFHGFGQTSQVYLPIEKHLGDRFTVFAIDLFFHGHSRYVGSQLLAKKDWYRIIQAFLLEQCIDRFSLMGFSLGGRFALTTADNFSDRIDQLILIAPDGITRSFWYELATGSKLGRRLFRYVLRHLPLLHGLGHILTQVGLLNRTVMRFVEISLSTFDQREQVYKSWTQFRRVQPNLDLVGKRLTTNEVRVYFFTGAFDRLVPGAYILPLTKKLRNYELTVLKTGHNRLIELATEQLVRTY
ncbi:alpha/beta fold hydrolase [Spirosoma validum]|uniref:Alpha/beta hydrolase n=1 Tax=Spirosoma validum TaxID=2771355 RepID=A0A927B3R7_9BACT|nr:alpha/beta hydrolase [Spirosoma validum]MBD2754773.1 alpha/beta hydrolase [Spirosoma validum]